MRFHTDKSVPSTIIREDAEDLCNDAAESKDPSYCSSALGIFLASLMARSGCSSATSSFSVASAPIPAASVSIVEDTAKALHRDCSLSYRRANHDMKRLRRRGDIVAIHAKRISRWESRPQSHNHKKNSTTTFGSMPQRRLSPSPASSGPFECYYQTREAIGEAHILTSDIETLRPSDTTFTVCSTWLDIVAHNASYSPKPKPRSLKMMTPPLPAKTECVARLPKKESGDTVSSAAYLKAKRAAALSGAPRRPHRQVSLTDVNLIGNLSLKEVVLPGAEHLHSREHHDHPSTSMAVPEVTSDGYQRSNNSVERKLRVKHAVETDGSEGSSQDAYSAEWMQVGARSA
jgi:hypothetical protein